jgi:hypothetical protein
MFKELNETSEARKERTLPSSSFPYIPSQNTKEMMKWHMKNDPNLNKKSQVI